MKDNNIYVPKISVIVPVYNVEKFLPSCINSILAQNFTDFELLLIDDGSPDNCGKICDKYMKIDSRITVFHKENGGVSSARNLGLDHAKGEWIVFVDSDDSVNENYLRDLINYTYTNNALLLSGYMIEGKKTSISLETCHLKQTEAIKYYINKKLTALSAPYSKLYNKEILNKGKIRFPTGIHMGEDAIFVIRYLNLVDDLIIINKYNYNVRDVPDSLSSKYYDFQSEWNCYKIWKEELLKLVNKYENLFEDPLRTVWEDRISGTFNRCLQCLYKNKENLTIIDQIKILKTIPQQDIKEYTRYYHPSNFKKRILKFLISHRLFLIYTILGFFDKYKRH